MQIRYVLGSTTPITITIYDVRGRLVRLLERRTREPGEYSSTWDRNNESGLRTARGMYLVRLVAAAGSRSRKFVVVGP